MAYVDINGERIAYTRKAAAKNEERLTLLLVHGAGGSQLHWPTQLRYDTNLDVIAVDLPGHGRSSGQGRQSIAAYTNFIISFAGAIGLAPFILAGHSMGGAIAQETALRAPERLRGLILVDTGASLPVNPALLQGLQEDYETTIRRVARWSYRRDIAPEELETYIQGMLNVPAQTVYDDFAACDRWSRLEDVARIRLPTLVLCGQEDRMTPVKYSQYLATQIPAAWLKIIPGGGHMVALEQPQKVVSAVLDFVSSLT